MDKMLKITYNGGDAGPKKLNAYLRMPSKNLTYLCREIELYLFQERQLPKCDTRIYWLDRDNDEIEIVNQNDYDIFLDKCEASGKDMHLQLAPVTVASTKEQAADDVKAEIDPTNFVIHDGVECDGCGLAPMVGFRYKCVQCPNFDLCQRCEAGHKHPHHLMIRMPTNNGPSVIDAWLSGPGCRRNSRRSRGHCPFTELATAAAAPAGAHSHKESRRERKHARRHGGGFLSQFMEIMTNATENPSGSTETENAAPTKAEEAKPQPSAAETTKSEEQVASPSDKADEEKESFSKSQAAHLHATNKSAEEPASGANEKPQEETKNDSGSAPNTPVINMESLSQLVPPECMRAGIEILNNFSEMFAKMMDPAEGAASGWSTRKHSTTSMASSKSSTSHKTENSTEASETVPVEAPKPTAPVSAEAVSTDNDQKRTRSESLDQDWQMIDNTTSSPGNVTTIDSLINLDAPNMTPTPSAAPVADFNALGEMLRQHISEEQRREQTSTQTQTPQVDTVSTSTSTTSVSTNSTATTTASNPIRPDDKRSVPVYHTDERINMAIHAMMAMGFSNDGAWLTQLLESVNGDISAALDIMHTSQTNRN